MHSQCQGPEAGSCLVCWEEQHEARVPGAEQVRERGVGGEIQRLRGVACVGSSELWLRWEPLEERRDMI